MAEEVPGGELDLAPLERVLAERACERLVVEYARRLDFGQADRVAELFTDDAVWEMPGRIRFEGRDELAAGIPSRLSGTARTTRHVCTNIAIDVLGRDEAVGFCYLVNYRYDWPDGAAVAPAPSAEPKYIGEYTDRFVRTADGWRIAHRRSVLAFSRHHERDA
jgi:uncharacterized protein (TIGR02246 family)